MSLLIEHVDQAEEFARPLPDDFQLLARRFWPGPLTMIVPAAPQLPLIAGDGSGYGLTGMRERAELLGGQLTTASTASGFRVDLQVPA